MRTFAPIQPTFWTRGSGKRLRNHPFSRLLALYLMTAPDSNMIGLYYVSRRTLLEHTGIPDTELNDCFARVAEVEIAFYDHDEELVFVKELARYQIGASLSAKDNRRPGILKQLALYGEHRFVLQWLQRYCVPYGLDTSRLPLSFTPAVTETRSPPPSPPEAHPEGYPQGHQEGYPQGHPQAHPQGAARYRAAPLSGTGTGTDLIGRGGPGERGEEPPAPGTLADRARLWVQDPARATLTYPGPHRWPEMVELATLVAEVFGQDAETLRTETHRGVRNVLQRWAEGNPQARMRQAIQGSRYADAIKDKPDRQTLATIFTDADCVDKYCRLAKSKDSSSAPRRDNRVMLTEEAQRARDEFFGGNK